MRLTEFDPIKAVKGVGEVSAAAFQKIGVESVGDLLMHLPLRYDFFGPPGLLNRDAPGVTQAVEAKLTGTAQLRGTRRLPVLTVRATDGETNFTLTWFRMPYLKQKLRKGAEYVFRGRLVRNRYGLNLEQAAIYTAEEYEKLQSGLQPVYASVGAVSSGRIRKAILAAFDDIGELEEFLPPKIVSRYGLMDRLSALRGMHFPRTAESVIEARRRMVFEEFLLFILSVRSLEQESEEALNHFDFSKHGGMDKLFSSLPYELTKAQQRVHGEIQADLTSPKLMNRLVQGDVGSGKTILALLALARAADNGHQGALMAPTEVLAKQHYDGAVALFERYGLPYRVELVTGSMTAAEKKKAYQRIAAHEADIIIGTHALIQEKISYNDLALVITDEQHRFGVRQRENLSGKGSRPHILVMSATPIPRTMAIILYGDLDISVLDELPKNRIPIKNCVVGVQYRPKAYEFIQKQVREGHQAYVICPKVEADEETTGENVLDTCETLRQVLPPGITVEYLHGRMRPAQKNDIMERFAAGAIDVLVSTTVVEVGVDVPNATVMMIENAESFGLAQLHQLRGRVGRGSAQSYCIFVNTSGDPEKQERLDILNHSNDGFEIASEDLKMRGPGDVFGIRQSGVLSFRVGDVFTDSGVLQDAAEAAKELLPELAFHEALNGRVKKNRNERLSL
ncbi:MAG: ATP-dependent DNA helicase RecG [Lachnospiraceae bacterium]|nr:ATP-dependent DNA helicase RecG [Lachnospiraceae bacterium]